MITCQKHAENCCEGKMFLLIIGETDNFTLQKTTDLAMAMARRERGWSRKQKVTWRRDLSSPSGRHLPFFFILLHGDGISCRHFVAKDDGIFLFFNLMRGDGSVYRHLLHRHLVLFFLKNGR